MENGYCAAEALWPKQKWITLITYQDSQGIRFSDIEGHLFASANKKAIFTDCLLLLITLVIDHL